MGQPTIDIVIPVYNEKSRIPLNIDMVFSYLKTAPFTWNVYFVNDGSTDDTDVVLREYQKKYTFTVHTYKKNRGKGYAVRQGLTLGTGDWVVFFDIDLATPVTMLDTLVTALTLDYQIVIGSRRHKDATIAKHESSLRTFLGQGFTKLSNILVPHITDFTCGFKAYRRDVADMLAKLARIDRWGFDTELLYIAHLHKIPVHELPVMWTHDDDSRVNVFHAVISSAKELFLMFVNRIRGYYT